MAFKIAYKASVKKDLKNLTLDSVRRILDAVETDLASHPGKDKSLKGQFKGLHSYRVGDFRVIYTIIGETILILRIAHRKGA